MSVYVTSDLHFNHDREFVYKPRGFNNIYDMNRAIIERWNNTISEEDDVYVLGDLCLGGAQSLADNKSLISQLRGNIYVVRGNHDTDTRIAMYHDCWNINDVEAAYYFHYKGYHFFMSHFPCLTANLEKESLKQCTINLFGHTHQQTNFYNDMPFMYHVGVDSHNCTPVLLDDAIEDMKQKIKECKGML